MSLARLGFLFITSPLITLSGTVAAVQNSTNGEGVLVSTIDVSELGDDSPTWCTIQDKDGVLFFGKDELVVTNGESWKSYQMGDAYAIRSLDFSPDGRLWAAAVNEIGWFSQSPTGSWDYHSLRSELPEALHNLGDVWNVYATDQDVVFVTQSKVITWDGTKFTWKNYHTPRRLITFRNSEGIHVYHQPSGLLKIVEAGATVVAHPPEHIGSSKVFWSGTIGNEPAFVTLQGVGILTTEGLQYPDPQLSKYLGDNILTSVELLADDSLALGTLRGGIVMVGQDLRLRRIVTSRNGLPTNEIYSLYRDHADNLWGTSSEKIFRIRNLDKIAVFNQRNGLPETGSLDIVIHEDQPVILTTDGVYQRNTPDGDFSKHITTHGAHRDIISTPQGLLMGASYGVYGLEQDTPPYYQTSQDIFKIKTSPKTDRYYAADGRRIIEFSITDQSSRPITNTLPDISDDFVLDAKGRLWISTISSGLYVAKPDNDTPVNAEPATLRHGFPHEKGYPQLALLDDTVIATGPNGGYWLNPKTDQFETIANYPTGETIALSNRDAQGRLWAALKGAQKGMPARMGQLERFSGGVRWIPRAIDGIATAGQPRALKVEIIDQDNRLWIAGSDAVLRISQPETMLAQPPSQPLLRAIVRDDPDTTGRPITSELPYTTKRIHLEFSSTDFARRDTLRYQTMLTGVDPDWSPPTNNPELDLANLREGDYTFKVRVVADTGLISPVTELRFSIATPWWRTPYAYGGYVLFIGISLTGLYHLRIRSIRRRGELLEKTVQLRTSELEKANAAKTEFVASMSHEIRNPMNGIIGSAHALEQTSLNQEQSELVATLRNCASFLGSLVEDVLDFSSIEAGAFTVQQEPCYPRTILESVSKMLAGQAVVAGAHFELEIDPELPTQILADASRIQQIVVNYATNALKFSGGGRIRLSAYHDNNNIAFAVTDNGPGISTEEQTVLFTRFSRLKTARNAGVAGTGLGLAVCRALAEKMGGSVGVASAPRRGSTFFLRIPLQSVQPNELPQKPSLPSMQGARALVVEDIDYNARALSTMLKQLGLTVDVAPDGASALKHLSSRSYHAVFLDYDLPDMSGLEVARRLRLREDNDSHALVIATTAYSTIEDRRACLDAGMDVFLGKPITPEKLQNVLAGMPPLTLPSASIDLPIDPHSGLNLRMLNYLADNKPGGLKREIDRYLESLTATHGELLEALLTRNRPALGKAAHRMLSHGRMVEANTLIVIAEEIEAEADYAEIRRLDELGDEMATAITELRKTLVRHRQAQTPA